MARIDAIVAPPGRSSEFDGVLVLSEDQQKALPNRALGILAAPARSPGRPLQLELVSRFRLHGEARLEKALGAARAEIRI
jgi:hypothetical protein